MSLDNPCLKYFVPEKQNRGERRRTHELEPSSRLSRQVSRDSLCRDGKPAEARESAAPRHRHGRAPRRARGSTRGTASSRGSQGGLSRVDPGPERSHKGPRALGPAARVCTFGFLQQRKKVTQQPPWWLRGGGHTGPETPRRSRGHRDEGPGTRQSRGSPGLGRRPGRSESPPSTPFNAEPGKAAQRDSPRSQWSSWCRPRRPRSDPRPEVQLRHGSLCGPVTGSPIGCALHQWPFALRLVPRAA